MIGPGSLRGRLLLGLGLGLTLLWLLLALWLHGEVKTRLAQALDERLVASARMVASLVAERPARSNIVIREPSTMLPAGIACEISGLRGEILARSSGAPAGLLATASDGFAERWVGGERWRVYTASHGELRVASAERMSGRWDFMRQVAVALLVALAAGLLSSLALVWWAVGRALGPLSSLRQQIAERDPDDDTPLAAPRGAAELAPMVAALNHWSMRVRAALARERRLTDDLAHELRTPLAAIRTQLQVAGLTEGERSERARSAAEQAARRLGRSLDHLLALAREDEAPSGVPPSPALARLSAEVAADLEGVIGERELTLRLCGAGIGAPAAAEGLVRIALRNVLENAVRHSPPGGLLMVRCEDREDACVAVITDQGPGLAPEHRHLALDRGWHGREGGQGLGLAIVATIMARTGGTVRLDSGASESGLTVTLRWPRAGSV